MHHFNTQRQAKTMKQPYLLDKELSAALDLPTHIEAQFKNLDLDACQLDDTAFHCLRSFITSKLPENILFIEHIGYITKPHKNARAATINDYNGYVKNIRKILIDLSNHTSNTSISIDTIFVPLRTGVGSGHWHLIQLQRQIGNNSWKMIVHNSSNLGAEAIAQDYDDIYKIFKETFSPRLEFEYQQTLRQATNNGCGVVALLNILLLSKLLTPDFLPPTNNNGVELSKQQELSIKLTLLTKVIELIRAEQDKTKKLMSEFGIKENIWNGNEVIFKLKPIVNKDKNPNNLNFDNQPSFFKNHAGKIIVFSGLVISSVVALTLLQTATCPLTTCLAIGLSLLALSIIIGAIVGLSNQPQATESCASI